MSDSPALIGRIAWPASAEAACRHYLGFAIQVIEPLGLEFPSSLPNPLAIARRYIEGTLAATEYRNEATAWWRYIDRLVVFASSSDARH